MAPSNEKIKIPSSAITWHFSRSSGPGGQHLNKSDTRVELICDVTQLLGTTNDLERITSRFGTELRIVVSSQRSQNQNRRLAMEKLIDKLEKATIVPRNRKPTKPTRGSIQNRLDEKRKLAIIKAERRMQPDDL